MEANANSVSEVTDAPESKTDLKSHRFCVHDWVVDPKVGEISHTGKTIRLEPKVMDVLVYFAERPGEAVTRAELEETVWADVVVSYETLTSTIQKLRKAFNDDAHDPRFIETLPKRGYRLVAPVSRLDEPATASHSAVTTLPEVAPRHDRRPWLLGLMALAALSVVAVSLWPDGRTPGTDGGAKMETAAPGPSEKRTIAVLPFRNMSDDKEQEYFSDGLAEDLITDLSKISGLFVVARNSTFAHKGKNVDIQKIAKALNVRYVVGGSVRRSDNNIRINAELIDTQTGLQVWAERYDGTLDDIFHLQDAISEKIISALAMNLNQDEIDTIKHIETKNIPAYEYFLRGRVLFMNFSKDNTYLSRNFYQKAIELDPRFSRAYAMLAWNYIFEYLNGWSNSPEKTLERAMELADKSIALGIDLSVAHFVRGFVLRDRHQYEAALKAAQKSIEIEPSYANGHVLLATLYYLFGEPLKGLEMIETASRLNPYNPSNYPLHRGQALFILGRYDEAIASFKQGLKQNSTSLRLRVWLAATYAQVDRQDDAEWEVDQIYLLKPNFSLKNLHQAFPFRKPAELARISAALHKAGIKEPLK